MSETSRPDTDAVTRVLAEDSNETLPWTQSPAGEDAHRAQPGEKIGRYEVVKTVGSGGMGVVYEAYDQKLDRRVAVKVLRLDTAESDSGMARMEREAQALAKLSHPNVVQVYEVGQQDGATFVAMELIEGSSLREWFDEKPRHWREVLEMMRLAGRGLAAAHKVGLVHRDFKPQNVLVRKDGSLKVVDFGLAKRDADEDTGEGEGSASPLTDSISSNRSFDLELTQVGMVIGTPAYMAAEQHFGRPVTHLSDQFAFCVTMWEGLFGQRPYGGKGQREIAKNVAAYKVREPERTSCPSWLRKIVHRGLSPRPSDRWASMDELLQALSVDPIKKRRRIAALGGAALAVAAVSYSLAKVQTGPTVDPCADVEVPAQEIWNSEVEGRLRSGFSSTRLAYADDAATRVVDMLDSYISGWSEARTQTCEAHQKGEQSDRLHDLGVSCLDAQLENYRARIELLESPDEELVQTAVSMIEKAPGLANCTDPARLQASVAPPEDSQTAFSVAEHRRQLASFNARIDAAQWGALDDVESLESKAAAIGYAPLEAETTYSVGKGLLSHGDVKEAIEVLEKAYFEALRVGHDEIATMASSVLITALTNSGSFDSAKSWIPHAQTVFERAGEPRTGGQLLANAVANYAQRTGDFEEAAAAFEDAIELSRDENGEETAQTGAFYNNLCQSQMALERLDDAEQSCQRAIEVVGQRLGERHPRYAITNTSLANVYLRRGNFEKAVATNRVAVKIAREALGDKHPDYAVLLTNYGTALRYAGQREEALEMTEQVLEIRSEAFGEDSPMLATPLNNIAELHRLLGHVDKAIESSERAVELQVAALGDDHYFVAFFLSGLGLAQLDKKDYQAARATFERALDREDLDKLERGALGEIRFGLARARFHLEGDTTPEILALARQARDDYASYEGGYDEPLAEVEAWLSDHESGD